MAPMNPWVAAVLDMLVVGVVAGVIFFPSLILRGPYSVSYTHLDVYKRQFQIVDSAPKTVLFLIFPLLKVKNPAEKSFRWFKNRFGCAIDVYKRQTEDSRLFGVKIF